MNRAPPEVLPPTVVSGRPICSDELISTTTKPGAIAPGICLLSRGFVPGDRARGGRAQLCVGLCLATAVIVFRSGDFQLWAELPALAPGARCRLGRSVESGEPQAGPLTVQWTAIRPGTSHLVKSVGAGAGSSARSCRLLRGVSSINGASESRCSHDGSASKNGQGAQRIRYRSSPEAMGLHEGGFMGAPTARCDCPPGPAARPRRQRVPAAGAPARRPPG